MERRRRLRRLRSAAILSEAGVYVKGKMHRFSYPEGMGAWGTVSGR